MTLMIDLTPEIEAKLRDEAAKEGLDPDRYVLHTLTERWGHTRDTDPPHLPQAKAVTTISSQVCRRGAHSPAKSPSSITLGYINGVSISLGVTIIRASLG